MKKTIRDIDVKGRKVLVRCDFNVPMQDGVITDDNRITAALPTISYLKEHGAKVILMSHMGRPKGQPKMEYTLQPVADRLSQLLGQDVKFVSSPVVVDDAVRAAATELAEGDSSTESEETIETPEAEANPTIDIKPEAQDVEEGEEDLSDQPCKCYKMS